MYLASDPSMPNRNNNDAARENFNARHNCAGLCTNA